MQTIKFRQNYIIDVIVTQEDKDGQLVNVSKSLHVQQGEIRNVDILSSLDNTTCSMRIDGVGLAQSVNIDTFKLMGQITQAVSDPTCNHCKDKKKE